jgi:hypothetical protein
MADYSTASAVVAPPTFQQPQPFQSAQHQRAPWSSTQQPAYHKPVPYTPMASGTTTPANVSPTSPRTSSHLQHAKQLRPPKMPMYVPAVLRPTEKPARQSPPKANDSAVDSPEASFGSAIRRSTRTSIDSGVGTIASEESSEVDLGPVTGPPSRNHWKVRLSRISYVSCASISRMPAPIGLSRALYYSSPVW